METRKVFVLIIIINLLIFIIGVGTNNIVIYTNGGRMPVLFKGYSFQTNEHFSYSDKGEVNFWQLSDIFPIEKGDIRYTFSIGDYFMGTGLILLSVTILFLISYLFIYDFRMKRRNLSIRSKQ